MVMPQAIEKAIHQVKDQASFLQGLLADTLEWPIPEEIEDLHELAYGWTQEDLRAQGLERHLLDGHVWQIQLRAGQPWGIFVVEFAHDQVYQTALRQVLRGLVPSRRRVHNLPAWKHENLLFLCVTRDYGRITFAHFRGDKTQTARLATFGWRKGDSHVRTACEFNLPPLEWPRDDGADAAGWLGQWAGAFDVEAVTKRFFAEYHEVFETVEASVKGVPRGEPRRLYVQRLFNRLMFLYFIQRKGWLSFQGDRNYLRALFKATSEPGASATGVRDSTPVADTPGSPGTRTKEDFLNDRLYWTFFYGLNTAGENYALHSDAHLRERRGEVPFLNGGLFDLEDEYDVCEKVKVPNTAFAAVLDLFERYNFTATESTPLDIEVAVDPEMLGKVFEELVTGRHESGSYYTPRPIVAFMCREALKHYLTTATSDETAIARFVDEGDPTALADPEAVLNALRAVKVCDPARGSGAYLLGMMQELLRLRETLFAARGLDAVTVYRRKLEIIQNNLYGVDIDLFAVNIAKLRLWLSLAVDFDGAKPPPLPNLDFKIECGDSLTGPNPEKIDDLFRHALIESADRLADLKAEFLQTYGANKKKLAEQIKSEEEKLRQTLHESCAQGSIDWRVAFAEVFKNGGFDIALENPPYVRQELFKETKPILRDNFPKVFVSSADLYVYFFARTHQILRAGGTACVISSNKWLKAGYGELLRRFFAESTWVQSVVDFGHAKQIFQNADVFPSILVFSKPTRSPVANAPGSPPTVRVCAIPREQLRLDDLTRQVETDGFDVPRDRLAASAWTLEPPGVVALLEKIRRVGVPLKDFAGSIPYRGILTGLNDAFLLDTKTKERLVAADPKSAELFKPYLRGQDVNRWHPEWAGLWMLALKSSGNHPWPWANAGRRAESIFAATYPAIHAHLNQYRDALIKRQDQGEHWWELRACAYWDMFNCPKIIYPEITWRAEWCFDERSLHINNTVYILPAADYWLLSVANSPLAWWFAWRTAVHGKDEALRFIREFVQELPICPPTDHQRNLAYETISRLIQMTGEQQAGRKRALDWLCSQFDLAKPSQKLRDVAALDEDALVAEVQKSLGKRNPLSVAQVKALKDQHVRSIRPLQTLAAEARRLERRVADLVNAAYGLTEEEVALMWRTAPPRMPGEPPGV